MKKWAKITIYILLTLSLCAVICSLLVYIVQNRQWKMLRTSLLLAFLCLVFDTYFSMANRQRLRELKGEASPTDEIEKFIKAYTSSRFFENSVHNFFSPLHRTFFLTPYERDLDAIATFHRNVSKGKRVKIPKLRTQEGKQFWTQYIKAYNLEHTPPTEKDQRKTILEAGGWLCSCGRANPSYTSTCVCGTAKRNVPQSKNITAKTNHWQCACGRENPNYTSTCVCGGNKRDALNPK